MNPDRIIAIVNQKGGVGKTTTSINLAAALAAKDLRVLLIDMDPQGNASTGLGIPRAQRERTVYNVMTERLALDDAIQPTQVSGLSVLPSHVDLSAAEMEIGQAEGRTRILREAVQVSEAQFDYVLIDCPPSLNLLTINALAAARSVIVPLQCEFFALEGLSQLLQTVEMAKSSINPSLAIDGVMLTMYDRRNRLSAQVAEDVRKHLGRAVFETIIPRNVRIAEAPSFGQPVISYAPSSKGAKAYLALADELIKKHRNRK
ncbi:ParA family protein [Litorimonas sp. WD9-15]|uniref:ParA family protein n=1 Tax=Litorimonas sp. WD9-15 TaxID=3418716 RepID=UPI003D0236FC